MLRVSPPQWEESWVNWSVGTPFYSQFPPSTESLHTREFCAKTIRYSLCEEKALTPLPGGDCGPMTDWVIIQNRSFVIILLHGEVKKVDNRPIGVGKWQASSGMSKQESVVFTLTLVLPL